MPPKQACNPSHGVVSLLIRWDNFNVTFGKFATPLKFSCARWNVFQTHVLPPTSEYHGTNQQYIMPAVSCSPGDIALRELSALLVSHSLGDQICTGCAGRKRRKHWTWESDLAFILLYREWPHACYRYWDFDRDRFTSHTAIPSTL